MRIVRLRSGPRERARGRRTGGEGSLRRRDGLLRALPRLGEARRGAAAARRARPHPGTRRAGVLDPAAPPEGARGVAVAGGARRAAAEALRRGGEVRRRDRLRERRHGGVHRRGERVLLPRAERADPGRASRHRGGHGHRSRRRADPDRRGRGARSAGARARVTRSRCGSTPRIHGRSCRRRAGSSGSRCPRTCASIRASSPATRSARATTR